MSIFSFKAVFKYSECQGQWKKASGSGYFQSHYFESLDSKRIRITFFNEDSDLEHTLETDKVTRRFPIIISSITRDHLPALSCTESSN